MTDTCCPGAALFGPVRCTCRQPARPPTRARKPRPPVETEAAFTTRVVQAARLHGWRVTHFRPARTANGSCRTAVQGDVGFPDLVLARDGVVIFAELKTARGTLSPEQRVWLAALGDRAVVWRPADWDEFIQPALRAPRPPPPAARAGVPDSTEEPR